MVLGRKCVTMPVSDLHLSHIPSVNVGMLIRRPSGQVFQAVIDPAITTKFWFTKSSGKVVPGADLRWDWEMYGVSTTVRVKAVEETAGSSSTGVMVTSSRPWSSASSPRE